MKTAIKIVAAFLTIPFFILVLLASFIKFRFLNEKFWLTQYERPGFRETLAIKKDEFASAFVREQLKKQGISESQLDSGFVSQQVEVLTDSFTENEVQKFLEENTSNILRLANGETNELILYAPLDKLGVNTASGVLDDLQVSENEFEVSRLLSNPSSPGLFSRIFDYLQSIGRLSTILFVSAAALLFVILYIYYSMSRSLGSLGKLFIALGIIGFVLVIPIQVLLSNPDVFSAAGSSEPAQVATSLFIPIVLAGFVSYTMYFSGGTIILGLTGFLSDKFLIKEK